MSYDKCNPYNPYETPDPHFVPGYTGYCPRRTFHIGKTYGQETLELLSTSRPVPTTLPRMDAPPESRDVQLDPIYMVRNRLPTTGDIKYREDMWPGYTGYIPARFRTLGKTYGRSCREAIAIFETEQRCQRLNKENELPQRVDQGGDTANVAIEHCWQPEMNRKSQPKGPLKRLALDAEWPVPTDYNPYADSPYAMSNRDPRKYYVPGYTGYIPGLRFATGVTYGLATNHGLCRFTDSLEEHRNRSSRPVIHDWHKPDAKISTERPHLVLPNHVLPYLDTGCVPKYTGYVPGIRYNYGETFGNATKKLLKFSNVTGVTDVNGN